MLPLISIRDWVPRFAWIVCVDVYMHYYLQDLFHGILRQIMIVIIILLGFMVFPQIFSGFKIYFQGNERNNKRIKRCPSLTKGRFFPTLYLPYAITQILWDHKISKFPANLLVSKTEGIVLENMVSYSYDKVTLNPNTQHVVHKEKNAVVVFLPGLTSKSTESYVLEGCYEALLRGFEVIVLHNRWNCDTLSLQEDKPVCLHDDLKLFLDSMVPDYPDKTFLLVGHSYGANTMINYLGKYFNNTPVKGAVAISCPFDLWSCSDYVAASLYSEPMVKNCRELVKMLEPEIKAAPKSFDLKYNKIMNSKTFREFDEHFTRKIMGVPSVDHYYLGFSSKKRLPQVRVPLLCLNSLDDPIVDPQAIPFDEPIDNSNLIMVSTRRGGHVNFFQGLMKPTRWFTKPTTEFLEMVLEENLSDAKKD